jgi:hypothetical protein
MGIERKGLHNAPLPGTCCFVDLNPHLRCDLARYQNCLMTCLSDSLSNQIVLLDFV